MAKAKYTKNLTELYKVRVSPIQKELSTAGTAEFWRQVISNVAQYKILYDAGDITPEQFKNSVAASIWNVVSNSEKAT